MGVLGSFKLGTLVVPTHTYIDNYTNENFLFVFHMTVVEDEDAAAYIISKAKDPSQLNLHNKSWYSPIHLAAKVNNANSVRDLILGGANVTERDARGNTALHIACAKG